MDKLQAILSVSQLIVIDADSSLEEKFCRAFQQNRESLFFMNRRAIDDLKFPQAHANSFIILNIDRGTKLNSILEKIDLSRHRLLLLNNTDIENQKNLPHRFYFLQTNDIAISFLQFWEKELGKVLIEELRMAKSNEHFQLTEKMLDLPLGNSEARARLAFALATQLSVDLHLITLITRLALFYPLITLDNWQEMANGSNSLQEILPLLEQKLLLGKIPLASSCPQDLSIELLVVECALFAQKHIGESEKNFRAELKTFSSQLPFRLRTLIRNSAERCFKYLWRENEAA